MRLGEAMSVSPDNLRNAGLRAAAYLPSSAGQPSMLEWKVTWVLATLLVVSMCYAIAQPVSCAERGHCWQYHDEDQDLRSYSRYITAALSSVLVHEMASVILTTHTARKAIHLIPNVRESLLPSVLLCITFGVLIMENVAFQWDSSWYAHAANLGRADLNDTPVYTIFYAEWLINVPILLILAGSMALQRPMREVAEVLVMTNTYIVFAWVAHFISSAPIRYCVVVTSFLMYFRASWMMVQWVVRWRQRTDEPILGRPLLSFVLIMVFGLYGVVYLLRLHGILGYREERIFHTTMNFTSKLFASMALAGIRSSEFQEVLLSMLANTQTSFKRALNCKDQPKISD